MNFQINFTNPLNSKVIEKGRSTVKLVVDPNTNKKYAVKYVPFENDSLEKEWNLLRRFDHPNIIKAVEFNSFWKENYLATEYMEMSDLFNFVVRNQDKVYSSAFLSDKVNFEKFWRTIFIQAVDALVEVHSYGYAHLDIKPENFLLNSEFTLKLIDFEFVFEVDTTTINTKQCSKYCGSGSYFSPEIREKKFPYDPYKSDVFSLAVTMLNLMSRYDTFPNTYPMEFLYRTMKNNKFPQFWGNMSFSRYLSKPFKELIEKMLNYHAELRPSMADIKKHEWFNKEIFTNDEIKGFFQKINNKTNIQSLEANFRKKSSLKKVKLSSD